MDDFLSAIVSNSVAAGALALVAWGLTKVWRSPQLAHALWLLVLVKLVTPPLYAVPLPGRIVPSTCSKSQPNALVNQPLLAAERDTRPIEGPPVPSVFLGDAAEPKDAGDGLQTAATNDTAEPASAIGRPPLPFVAGWRTWLAAIWGIGVVAGTTVLVQRVLRFRRLLAETIEADAGLTAEVGVIARHLGMARGPAIRILDAHVPPLVCAGWRRPLLLLPARLLSRLDRQQRDAVLVHELAHLRRGDHLVRWFEVCVRGLFWWNPLAWWAGRNLRRAEEECCDAWVVWLLPDGRRSYGKALLWTVEFLAERPALRVVGAALGGSHIQRRIEMIVTRKLNHRMSWSALAAVLVLGVAVLPVAAQKPVDETQSGQDSAVDSKPLTPDPIVAQRPPTAPQGRDLEARIEQLERLVRELSGASRNAPSTIDEAVTVDDAVDVGKNDQLDRAGAEEKWREYSRLQNSLIRKGISPLSLGITKVYALRGLRVVKMKPEDSERMVMVTTASVGRPTEQDPELTKTLLDLTAKFWTAAANRDSSVSEKHLADDYFGIYSNSAGVGRSNKATDVAASKRRRYFDADVRNIEARWVSQDTAVLTYVYGCKVEEAGRTWTYRNHQATQVWTKKDGEWFVSFANDFILPGGE